MSLNVCQLNFCALLFKDGLLQKYFQPGEGLFSLSHVCILCARCGGGRGALMQPRAAALTLTIFYVFYFSWLPQSKLSIAAQRRPVFVSALQHCKFGAAELARRFSVKGRVPLCFGRAETIHIDFVDVTSEKVPKSYQNMDISVK
jgi:hypothetical protein